MTNLATLFATAALALLAVTTTSATAQTSCGNGADAVFQGCLDVTAARQRQLCDPLQAAQGFPYFSCMCQLAGEVVGCYASCPGLDGQRQIAVASQTSYCNAAAGLKPVTTASTAGVSSTTPITGVPTGAGSTTSAGSAGSKSTGGTAATAPTPTATADARNDAAHLGEKVAVAAAAVAAAGLGALAL
ncbi:hypothetical protein GGF31_005087 [Allomyces arbusculus]|nr:hypothetical protein GGF31_005087 [Allomyces arbusculus]